MSLFVEEPESLSVQEARKCVLEDCSVELSHLGLAVRRDGESLVGGIPARRVSDVLELGEVENWPRTGQKKEGISRLFCPLATIARDDRVTRTFISDDLGVEEEEHELETALKVGTQFRMASASSVRAASARSRIPKSNAACSACSAKLGATPGGEARATSRRCSTIARRAVTAPSESPHLWRHA